MSTNEFCFFQHNFSEVEMDVTEIYDGVAETILAAFTENRFPAKTGIYLFSPDSGIYHSIGLWKNAIAHGPDFANPRNFPWTLACCPASFLARSLNAHGPNTTLIGGIENLPQITEWVQLHADQDLIEVAIVIHLQSNFNTLDPTKGFCKGAVITIRADFGVNTNFEMLKQFFLEN